MPTLLTVYNARDAKTADDYEKYLRKKKVAFVRSLDGVVAYEIYRVDMVLAPVSSNAKDLPAEPPYQFVARLEISDLGKFAEASASPEMQKFTDEYSAYIDPGAPLNVFVVAHQIEPGS